MRRYTRQPALCTLRANWTPRRPGSPRVSGAVAQACEYGQLMGPEALRRQWTAGYTGRRWKLVLELLRLDQHLKKVA